MAAVYCLFSEPILDGLFLYRSILSPKVYEGYCLPCLASAITASAWAYQIQHALFVRRPARIDYFLRCIM